MAAKILTTLLILCMVFVENSQCTCPNSVCEVVVNTSPQCVNKDIRGQCVCDFTCTKWSRPCNWVLTCPEEIQNINQNYRKDKNKLFIFRLPNRSHRECMEINHRSRNGDNCCEQFCRGDITVDACF
ncbi:uncharacterized protein LOC110179953 [Drosophila serrata]|uniref:uncharacterized protein LOC110179953 n=1 Tax=Drosophila serrata TaxID=7274 RepID=UPI000A1D1CBF|nr:uncharacterized protein LOC110179953 [Drosophila serrata]